MHVFKAALVAALSGLALSSAQGAFVSFASDSDHTSFTFRGTGNSVRDAQDPSDPVDLLVDDNNGALVPITFAASEFGAQLGIRSVAAVPMGGNLFTFVYEINGAFSIGNLSAQISHGTMTVLGGQLPSGARYWGSTATIQANDQFGASVDYTWSGAALPAAYDMPNGLSFGPDDASFTLTVLHAEDSQNTVPGSGGMGVLLNGDNFPVGGWVSEGSYSGQLHAPAPAAAGLLGLSTVLFARRRRA